MIATIYALLYGDHFALHQRLLESLERYVPKDKARVVLWCNTVGARTAAWIAAHLDDTYDVVYSDVNVPKYEVMRELFHGEHAPQTPWIIWFDDDSFIDKPDWWDRTMTFIDEAPRLVHYLGEEWFVHHLPGQWEFIQEAEWFKGLEPAMMSTKTKGVKKPGIKFAQGAYWWLSTDTMKLIDWPDPRLSHNGGDTLLGEAVRQQGLPLFKFKYGVRINKGKRRGRSDRPAGSSVNTRR